jgi:hypothetical protein
VSPGPGQTRNLSLPPGAPPTATATLSPTPTRTASLTPTATGAAPPTATATSGTAPCLGDCNADGFVTVDEIVRMVNIALGSSSVTVCPRADGGGDGLVTVDEIVTAVNRALNGCA